MKTAVIVVAAGSGTRLGFPVPKALVPFENDTILGVTLLRLSLVEEPLVVVVVGPQESLADVESIARAKFEDTAHTVSVTAGGDTRQQSVRCGLEQLPDDIDIILVHDAARPGADAALYASVIAHVRDTSHATIPALVVADSLKRVESGRVLAPVDRAGVVAVQTPQGFPASVIRRAYAADAAEFTDDAGLVAAIGETVDVIPGDARAAKITSRDDLVRLAVELNPRQPRAGLGIDIHAFSADTDSVLTMAGLSWPGVPTLDGHSDGDVVLHAVCDSLLSACALGDLGSNFGTSRPEYAGADSSVFVRETLQMVKDAGFVILSVAVQVVAERPRIAPRRIEVERHLSALIKAPVSFAATTTDGLGFLGSPDGIAAVATASVRQA